MLDHQRVNDTNTRTYVDTTFCGWIFKAECWAILRNMNDLNLPWNASRAIFTSKIILRILLAGFCLATWSIFLDTLHSNLHGAREIDPHHPIHNL